MLPTLNPFFTPVDSIQHMKICSCSRTVIFADEQKQVKTLSLLGTNKEKKENSLYRIYYILASSQLSPLSIYRSLDRLSKVAN